ncbi:CG5111 [Drosophila busckii]|uniref:CG5111 n=2 Tax=Drosophila busckii TaxID=30019 RepID=A0A0M3QYQ0_DROBS|nr:CG5111 [Drosophila busckii]
MNNLAEELSRELRISEPSCRSALTELQNNALRKLAARRQFNETGIATFYVRCVDSEGGTANRLEVKCALKELGVNLQRQIAEQLRLNEAGHVKCISAGRVLLPEQTLETQGLKNNQHLLVIVTQGNAQGETLYGRIRQIQRDVEMIVDSGHSFMELEDQDGNAMFLPPAENRALLLGMGLCEKARAALRREHIDEALLLFLEADEKFSNCNSKFLEAVDNYALLNLDIVWCYLCLKNITQLPDAQRRLDICERIFARSYGENYSRLYELKGVNCPERAHIMRLQLLQGIILFHQNRPQEALARLETADTALKDLKVDPELMLLLIDMGYSESDARLALRSSNGNVEQAVQFIQQRHQRRQAAQLGSQSERELSNRLTQLQLGNDWVHPRSVCRLMELGYERPLVMEALRRTDNDLGRSVDLLQSHAGELRRNLPTTTAADEQMLDTLGQLGFKLPMARAALETTQNDFHRAVDFLLKSFSSEQELVNVIDFISTLTSRTEDDEASTSAFPAASPSRLVLAKAVLAKASSEIEVYSAFKRFNEDLADTDVGYLDLTLEQEERVLNEYKQLLE